MEMATDSYLQSPMCSGFPVSDLELKFSPRQQPFITLLTLISLPSGWPYPMDYIFLEQF